MRNSTLFFIGFLLTLGQSLSAQQADPDRFIDRRNSPYSVYGWGDLLDSGFAYNRGLAGMTNAFKGPFNVNSQNPASYGDFLITNLEVGFHMNAYNLSSLSENLNASDLNISYLAMGFPLAKNLGMALGVQPLSKVSYSIEEESETELGLATAEYTGDGDIYRSFVGVGYAVGNKRYSVSAGINYNLVFGKVNRIRDSFLNDPTSFLYTRFRNERSYQGDYLQYGLQFFFKPKAESKTLIIGGLSGDIKSIINVDVDEVWERTAGGGLELEVESTKSEAEVSMPGRIGFGISMQNSDGWALGVEIEKTNWSSFNGYELDANFRDATKYALGFRVTPDATAFNNYLKTVQYRAGVYYNTGFLNLSNTDITEIGVTFGFGLPVRRNSTRLPNYSRLNLSFDIGQRGTTDSDLIQENYIKTTFGFTLNDKWFVKKKFD